MKNCFRLLCCLLLATSLVSCTVSEKRTSETNLVVQNETGNYKYAAWQLTAADKFEAINVLLDEADVLIENRAFNAASDKLERALRINPEHAPAWSRLSWVALQMNAPDRSVQMAKRSNSFAYANPDLQALNWRFIRAASKAMNDEDAYHRANQKIEALKIF